MSIPGMSGSTASRGDHETASFGARSRSSPELRGKPTSLPDITRLCRSLQHSVATARPRHGCRRRTRPPHAASPSTRDSDRRVACRAAVGTAGVHVSLTVTAVRPGRGFLRRYQVHSASTSLVGLSSPATRQLPAAGCRGEGGVAPAIAVLDEVEPGARGARSRRTITLCRPGRRRASPRDPPCSPDHDESAAVATLSPPAGSRRFSSALRRRASSSWSSRTTMRHAASRAVPSSASARTRAANRS
ncbi:MAG: hypothetical protein V7633_3793 [Pseudonocardia sp.]